MQVCPESQRDSPRCVVRCSIRMGIVWLVSHSYRWLCMDLTDKKSDRLADRNLPILSSWVQFWVPRGEGRLNRCVIDWASLQTLVCNMVRRIHDDRLIRTQVGFTPVKSGKTGDFDRLTSILSSTRRTMVFLMRLWLGDMANFGLLRSSQNWWSWRPITTFDRPRPKQLPPS